jgi:transcriptional regulator with XRE-family HTH domain
MAYKGRNRVPTFPARLAELRRRAGLTQQQLAQKAGTSLSSVSQLEQGKRAPSLELALRLAGSLAVPVDDLCRPAESVAEGANGAPRELSEK